ncbi:hypothetical protein PE066_02590 [Ramlibacter tataouinensis]|uniref:hypothetical protein n=1 Tax=Ramlibacter tataouinensis TaxID=94132 RepID=UPI0022F3FE2A|nr:hypothetical protein [Ramlibacter tataouinensis]WBY02443.1 hypothetical protein PE066_02590 [Ramlibacter tataouinensis]
MHSIPAARFGDALILWRSAEACACAAESHLQLALDLYCEGRGAAPAREAIDAARDLRRHACEALAGVLDTVSGERVTLPLI